MSEEQAERIAYLERQLKLRDLRDDHLRGFRDSAAPFVWRFRYLAGEGDAPPASVVVVGGDDETRWRGDAAEAADVDERLLQPVRDHLERSGQRHLLEQVAIQGKKLDASALAAEVDRLLGVIEGWGDESFDLDAVPSPP